ncbi:hypothetical protein BT67DRAFT_298306 [Trichocladium antarcticum]|uniref:Uncharacterized protein n=1 Tax=Trichocladium antarcticum TaxID=1450529 RepID=A0AAN6UKR0_9PEZI|nr:hypothetical protein BT67DRAFT_298306 [Trichocladium antarcticum]
MSTGGDAKSYANQHIRTDWASHRTRFENVRGPGHSEHAVANRRHCRSGRWLYGTHDGVEGTRRGVMRRAQGFLGHAGQNCDSKSPKRPGGRRLPWPRFTVGCAFGIRFPDKRYQLGTCLPAASCQAFAHTTRALRSPHEHLGRSFIQKQSTSHPLGPVISSLIFPSLRRCCGRCARVCQATRHPSVPLAERLMQKDAAN